MYEDEKNLYHYTYRKTGNEPVEQTVPTQDAQPEPIADVPVMRPVKKRHNGLKIASLALVCSLLGGAIGAGAVWAVQSGSVATTEIAVSDRQATQVAVTQVSSGSAMSDEEVYASNVDSVVSINTSATTNYFGQTVETASSGSGFIITTDGYIVTNYHVIEDSSSVAVTLCNNETYDATIIGYDEDYDLAVLKIEATDLQAVTIGDSEALNVGSRVLAIGNPLGELTFSMSGGMVSSVNRAINVSGTPFNMIQIDAAINPGNSGGPLFNTYGEVIGIVSAKYSSDSSGESVEGLGFAIPINDVSVMIEDIITNGYVTNKPYLAVTAGTMNTQMAAQTQLPEGLYIYSVEDGGAADRAGLLVGDVVIQVDDTTIASMDEFSTAKRGYTAGETATFVVYRNGETLEIEVTWDAVPEQEIVVEEQPAVEEQTPSTQTPDGYYYYSPFESFFGSMFGGR